MQVTFRERGGRHLLHDIAIRVDLGLGVADGAGLGSSDFSPSFTATSVTRLRSEAKAWADMARNEEGDPRVGVRAQKKPDDLGVRLAENGDERARVVVVP